MKKVLLFSLLALAACKKDKTKTALEELPPATQTGANTFGCLINGIPVYTTYKFSSFAGEGVEYVDYIGYQQEVFIYAVTKKNNLEIKHGFHLTVHQSAGGKYPVYSIYNNQERSCYLDVYSTRSDIKSGIYSPVDSTSGFVEITHYVPVSVLSGKFEMTLVNHSGDTLHITNGRFDLTES